MSASTETTQPAQRMSIVADATPVPPWTGVKFTCEGLVDVDGGMVQCGAEFQLEAADNCGVMTSPLRPGMLVIQTPACWDCGHVNVIECAAPADEEEEEQFPS